MKKPQSQSGEVLAKAGSVASGVVHGRFQPLHIGHMEYILAGKERCHFLWIGLTNPDTGSTQFDRSNPHRSRSVANPFSYYERLEMLSSAVAEAGVLAMQFAIVPFPIHAPEHIKEYVPCGSTFFLTIYDEWGERKRAILADQAIGQIEVLWRRAPADKVTSGTAIRDMLLSHDPAWRQLVPSSVRTYIDRIGVDAVAARMRLTV